MERKIISGAQAVAEAIKLCSPGVIAAYPITPQTPIMEHLTEMEAKGELGSEIIRVESEQSAISACIGSQATGVRSYTATSSQGLALMHEILFVTSGMRLPIVMSVCNRALSSPLNIWNDQQDSFSQRDSGWVQLYVENAQEAFDTHIQAFGIAEELRLPVMVCMDGYVVSHTHEPVVFLGSKEVKTFLPDYKPIDNLEPENPKTLGGLGAPEYYIHFKKQQQDAMEQALGVIEKINSDFSSMFGRTYGNGLIETVNLEGKDSALITIGSVSGTARELLERENIGLIRVKSLRPFPVKSIQGVCKNLKSIGVLEKDISFGSNGALYDDVRSALYGLVDKKPKISGFIAGLGGKDITLNDMKGVMEKIKSGKEDVEWLI